MAEDDGRLRFIEAATRRMGEHAFPYLTQVVGVGGEREGQPLSTGFFCEFQGRNLVVTTGHTIRRMEERGHRGVVFTRGEGEAPAVVDGDLFVFGEADLAVYVPSSDLQIASTKRYWPEDRIERDPCAIRRDYLVVTGFPNRFSRKTEFAGGGIISEALVYGAMMRYREEDVPDEEREQFDRDLPDYPFLPAGFLSPHQFAIHFDATPDMVVGREPESNGAREIQDWLGAFEPGASSDLRTFGAEGLSGSPVFRLGASGEAPGWTPESGRLVGVVTHWSQEHRALVATSSATLLAAFRKAIEDEGEGEGADG